MTAGQISDYTGAAALLDELPEAEWLLADRGYDADWFIRFPNSDVCVFSAERIRAGRFGTSIELAIEQLGMWGMLTVPGNLWRAMSRFIVSLHLDSLHRPRKRTSKLRNWPDKIAIRQFA